MTSYESDSKKSTRKTDSNKLRLPKDFHWKIMSKLADDLENHDDFSRCDADLKLFRDCVRRRDVNRYLALCDKHWGLKFQLPNIVNAPTDDGEKLKFLQDVRIKRLLTSFQKFNFPESLIDKRETALATFKKFESRCAATNVKDLFCRGTCSSYDDIYTAKHVVYVKQFIQKTLGLSPCQEDFLCALRHGPGASTDKRGNKSIPIEKFIPPIGVSPLAKGLFSKILNSDERWSRSLNDFIASSLNNDCLALLSEENRLDYCLKIEPLSVVTTVPKSAKTDRTICIEPTANVYMQLAIDSIIRKSLKRKWNIDINTQAKNQKLACIGSKTDTLVTIDLSGASDSICLRWLEFFPRKWANLLYALRMPAGTLPDGQTIHFQKLSAMGNGFTFAIETLIFASLLYAVLRVRNEHWRDYISQIAIYGDDIIFPTKFYGEYSYLLHHFGFSENTEKTFVRGPIRESCGHDYLYGFRIDRPTIKNSPKYAYELNIIHNRFFEVEQMYGIEFPNLRSFLVKYLTKEVCNYGPQCEDLAGWIFSLDPPSSYRKRYSKDYQMLYYKIKRFIVGHAVPRSKRHLPPSHSYFIPMMYLNRGGVRIEHSNVLDSSAHILSDNFFFLKNVVVVRTSTAIIPVKEWPRDRKSVV